MSFEVFGKDLDRIWLKANEYLWNCPDNEFDYVRPGVTVHSFHNQLVAQTANITRSITDFGYTKTKWSMLLKLYFEPLSFAMAVERIKNYRGEQRGRKYVVDIPITFKKRMNASGECLMGMTVRFSEKFGWEAEVMTRASESISRWGVDLVFIHVLLREMGKELGFEPKDVRVYWNSASMFQSILTAPLYVCLHVKDGEKLLAGDMPLATSWQEKVRVRYRRSFIPGERRYNNFKSQQRVVKAYDVLKGRVETPKDILTPEKLQIPNWRGIELPDNFKVKGGFK